MFRQPKIFIGSWLLLSLLIGCAPTGSTTTPVSSASTTVPIATFASPAPINLSSSAATDTSATPIATRPLTATPELPLDGRDAGVVVFYSGRDGNSDIYTMNADGSNLRRLTQDPAEDGSPAISPDGSRIVFLTARHDPSSRPPFSKYEIYVMETDGTNQRRLTTTEAAENHPAWSPDGKKILFDADYDKDGKYEIYIMNDAGTGVTRLTTTSANDQFADWSPDGTKIAFSSDRKGQWDIYVMDADGRNVRALTDDPGWELFPYN